MNLPFWIIKYIIYLQSREKKQVDHMDPIDFLNIFKQAKCSILFDYNQTKPQGKLAFF